MRSHIQNEPVLIRQKSSKGDRNKRGDPANFIPQRLHYPVRGQPERAAQRIRKPVQGSGGVCLIRYRMPERAPLLFRHFVNRIPVPLLAAPDPSAHLYIPHLS
ncbi:hypothetical protein D3C71_1897670 [compost metagenome]